MTNLEKFTKLRRKIFLRIKYVDHMPVNFSSPIANYYPFLSTIYILKKDRYKLKFYNNKQDRIKFRIIKHELCHWFIHKFLGNNKKLHNFIDYIETPYKI